MINLTKILWVPFKKMIDNFSEIKTPTPSEDWKKKGKKIELKKFQVF